MAAVEPDQWRRKYQEAVAELEREEQRWKAVEDVLRRIVGRLCIGARGVDETLDGELTRLGQAVRKTAEAPELESLLSGLSSAIAALDKKQKAESAASEAPLASATATTPLAPAAAAAPAPAPTAVQPPPPRFEALLISLLDRLDLVAELEAQVDKLRQVVTEARSEAELADACVRIADLANTQRSQLERDKAHVAAILQQVTGKLDDIANYLVREAADQESARGNSDELNRRMLNEVRSLDTSVKQASDLGILQQHVRSRLDAINAHLLDYRSREEARAAAYRERADKMRERIVELEKETDLLQRSLQQKARQVLTDPLTGLPNRLAYDERIDQAVRRRKRNGRPICVAAWDVDRFKNINDNYGHQAGDKVLQIIGQHLSRSVRETDFVARYGGEEFVMILEGASVNEAFGLVDRLRESTGKVGFHFRGEPVSVTISCGITELRDDDSNETVFERADKLLYQAKHEGRNRCVRD